MIDEDDLNRSTKRLLNVNCRKSVGPAAQGIRDDLAHPPCPAEMVYMAHCQHRERFSPVLLRRTLAGPLPFEEVQNQASIMLKDGIPMSVRKCHPTQQIIPRTML